MMTMHNQPTRRDTIYRHIAILTGIPFDYVKLLGEKEYHTQGFDSGTAVRLRKIVVQAYGAESEQRP
jgi:hypothetical protein